ncbi:TetR/AcrR family transcriptional regulator [Dyella flagellata]|uniref:TetR family transcriptional regulator n=2 Tax=Dyella flagellata TaxID=1867833 RepID=A0ABQ5XCE1_9GAMM|nr:TetR family transcriptional regulator [Dyella flagellata]
MQTGTKKDKTAKRPRGRPRAYDPETALRAAAEAFWKTGYSGTSLDDISAATGMNRPSLSAAFGDKHDIYVKALNAYWDRKLASMRAAFELDGTLAETLMRVYDAALSIYFSSSDQVLGCFVVGTAITEAPVDPEIRGIASKGFHALDAGFEARFKLARASGELKGDADPKALAQFASATMHSMAIRARSGTSRNELRKFAQKAVAMMCSGS